VGTGVTPDRSHAPELKGTKMASSAGEPELTVDQTSESTWDLLVEGSAMVAGTITKTGQIFEAFDAQNLPHGTFPTLDKALASFRGKPRQ
jgi:hypothetical protein